MPFSRWPRPTGVRAASTMTTSRPCSLVLMARAYQTVVRYLRTAVDVRVDVERVRVEEAEVARDGHEGQRLADERLHPAALLALDLPRRPNLHVEVLEGDRQAGDAL